MNNKTIIKNIQKLQVYLELAKNKDEAYVGGNVNSGYSTIEKNNDRIYCKLDELFKLIYQIKNNNENDK